MDDNKAAHSHLELYMNIFLIYDIYIFQCDFFVAAALEYKYHHHYGPNQRHCSITPLPTCLAGFFLGTYVSKAISLLQSVPTLSVPQVMLVDKFTQSMRLQIFNMAIVFDIYRYILMRKKSNTKMDIVIWPT